MKTNADWKNVFILILVIDCLILFLALPLSGCGTTIRYNPETGEVYYHSDTGKEFSDLAITKKTNGDIQIKVNEYKGEGVPPVKITLPQGIVIESGGKP